MLFRSLVLGLVLSAPAGCGAPALMLADARMDGLETRWWWDKEPKYERRLPKPAKPHAFPVAVIAHRGNSAAAPENTLAAFESAIRAGADAVELDVRLSADGHLVLMHDETVDRTTDGQGHVSELTLEQLRRLDAGGRFDPAFTGERIPTLDDALAVIKGRAMAFVEIKTADRITPRLVAEALARHGMVDSTLLISFEEAPLEAMRAIAPQLPLGALVPFGHTPHKRALSTRSSATLAKHTRLHRGDVKNAHSRAFKVYSWTVNTPEAMREQVALGVDGLITDDVATARSVLQALFP